MTATEYTHQAPRWADDAMRFAVRLGGSKADSEDAVQEALLALWQHRAEVAASGGKGYLLGATYRQMMQLFRRQRLEREHAAELADDEAVEANVGFDLREAIDRALQALAPQQRAVLQLRDVEAYSYREIADTLGLSEDSVQVTLFRARVNMRKHLKNLGYDNNR